MERELEVAKNIAREAGVFEKRGGGGAGGVGRAGAPRDRCPTGASRASRGRIMNRALRRTALVTGGNRGIGLATCRRLAQAGLRVGLAARDPAAGAAAAGQLRGEQLDVEATPLDVAAPGAARDCFERLAARGVTIDVLVNNAAVYPEGTLFGASDLEFRETFETNFFGALWTCRAFVPAMLASGYGRVVNVSSDYGQFADGLQGPAAYSLSKAALNALTLKLASEARGDVLVNAVHPGWVRTAMGGATAHRSPEEGADTVAWLAMLPADGPIGRLFFDRKPIPW